MLCGKVPNKLLLHTLLHVISKNHRVKSIKLRIKSRNRKKLTKNK